MTRRPGPVGRDGVIGLLLLAGSAWLWRAAGQIPQPPFLPLGPDFYPRLLLALLAALAAALVVADVRTRRASARRGPGLPGGADLPAHRADLGTRQAWRGSRRVLWTYMLFGAYVALLPVLGFRLATLGFVAILTWVLGPRTPRQAAVSAGVGLATALLTHAVFERALRILLPRGLW